MSQENRTPPTVGASVSGEELRQAHYTSAVNQGQGSIAAVCLLLGARSPETAVLGPEICPFLGLSDKRKLQQLLEEERERDPVCTRGRGYFLPDINTEQGRAEVRRCAETLEKRGARTIGTARKLRRLIRETLGQMHLDDEGKGDG